MTRRNKNNNRRKRGRSFGRPSRVALTSMTADGKLADPPPIRSRIRPVVVPMSYDAGTVTGSTSAITAGVVELQISGFSSKFAQYAAIFDQFMVLQWQVKFIATNPIVGIGSSIISIGNLHTAIDFDGNTTPTTAAQLESYSTYKYNRHPRNIVRRVKAMYPITIDTGNSVFSYERPKWVNTLNGIDLVLKSVLWVQDQMTVLTTGTVLYNIVVSADIKFRLSK